MDNKLRIKFCGAAGTVTGSQHLIYTNGKRILLDCGMFQGKREESFRMNKNFLFEPSEITSIILSHAHIDHAGNLPTLYRKGYNGFIYSTPATRDLCSIMLQDSAHIQEKDVEYVNKKRLKKGESKFNPLYTIQDVRPVMEHFKSFPYRKQIALGATEEKILVTFFDAGHILGSAQILIEIYQNGKTTRIGYSGDIGRKNLPILKDPDVMGQVDYLITESTYGNRRHDNPEIMEKQFEETINEAIERKGKIIIPSFSIGRTQDVVYILSKLFSENKIPGIPVFVDSPLSVNATEIFKIHMECYDEEISNFLSRGIDIFGNKYVNYITRTEDSKNLNSITEPCIIISSSGMCEAGRILHHLANNIEDSKNTILIISYMAENTLGKRLIENKDRKGALVKIFGEEHKLNAQVKVLNSFSAHADGIELLDYIKTFDRTKLKNIFLVHGEAEQQDTLKRNLENKGYSGIIIPSRGDLFELN